jgi:decaprenyl-phosphate phosphoribosyltransferase
VYAMAYYMHLGFKPNSPVQFPEKLYRQRKLMAIVTVTFLACALLLFVKIPGLERLLEPAILRP